MKIIGRKSMRCVMAALGLLVLSIGSISPKGSFVTAEAADGAAAAAAAAEIPQEPKVDADEDGMGGAEGEEEPAIPGATVQVLTDGDFERITQASTGATTGDWFVEFYAPWCGHCRKLDGTWTELAEKLGGEVNVGKVDATANRGLVKRFGVKGFPTLLFFSHGNLHKFAGPRKLDSFIEFAKGGFKKTDSVPVPAPPSLAGGLKGLLTSVLKDLEGVKDGKMPSQMTIMVLVGSLLLLLVLFATTTLSKPPHQAPSKRAKAD
ncbi:unnamed protein product [Ectocarpus sp. 6 AP-2014]